MKLVATLLLAALPALVHARSFQTFYSSFNDYNLLGDFMTNSGNISDIPAATDFSAPVGSGMFRHSGMPVADGYHSFSSFSGVEFQIDLEFGGVTYSFDESHLVSDTGQLMIYLANGAFHFVGPTTTYQSPMISDITFAGLVFFDNGNQIFSTLGTEAGPVPVPPSDYYGYAVIAPPAPEQNTPSYIGMGLYGTTETAYFGAAIPEPSSFAALAGLAVLSLAALRRHRRA